MNQDTLFKRRALRRLTERDTIAELCNGAVFCDGVPVWETSLKEFLCAKHGEEYLKGKEEEEDS